MIENVLAKYQRCEQDLNEMVSKYPNNMLDMKQLLKFISKNRKTWTYIFVEKVWLNAIYYWSMTID